jgi:diguanylate cyclase (GGDEF)-like protein
MRATPLHNEPILLADVDPRTPIAVSDPSQPWWIRLRRWWRLETTRVVEDDAIGPSGLKGRPIRLVLPAVLPVLGVAALVMLREPGNVVAMTCLVLGSVAIVYGLLADVVEQRLEANAWIPLVNTAFYALIISVELWCFLTLDHPRAHTHWIVFFLYFLLITATGLSDDPRQPLAAGCFSVLGYAVVVQLSLAAAADGSSTMAMATAPQLEWAGNAAKVGLLAAATFSATASARRGRAVRRLSLRDGLTGLLNRHAFDRCLAHLAQRAQRSEMPLTIAMIDIDDFKRVNDVYGHPTGDAVLRWVAAWLQRSFRTTDVVSRFGGEEFVVAFVDSDDLTALTSRLEDLRVGIEGAALRAVGGVEELRVTVSIGVAQLPRDGSDPLAALTRADERLYAAKQAGRNRIVA